MEIIPIDKVNSNYYSIALQNGKVAKLYQVIKTRVPEVNKNEDIIVYKYEVPCPVCNNNNYAFSYDGKYFGNIQINCKSCGVYFRPVIKRD